MSLTNNTTSENCVENLTYDKFLYISTIIWQISGLISIIIGIPGHCFQIVILSNRKSRRDPISFYFIAIAICELIFLLGLFWLWLANMSLIKSDPRQILSCGIFYSIIIGSTTLSNLYLASMSIDRSFLILFPGRYRSIVTSKHVILRILVISLIIFVVLIPHNFYFYYEPNTTLFMCDFHYSIDHRQIRFWVVTHAILLVSIPSFIVCISSFIFLHNRCKHKRTYKENRSKSARRLHQRSILIFLISLGLFFSLLPACFLEIYMVHDQFFLHKKLCSIRWKMYKILLSLFLTLSSINYSTKFYIVLCVSSSYRKQFRQLICCESNSNTLRSPKLNLKDENQQNFLVQRDHNNIKPSENLLSRMDHGFSRV